MRTLAILTVGIALLATPAAAQRGGGIEQFLRFDANGDGAVSRAEAERGRAALFDRMDADGDGYLSEAERTAGSRRTRALGNVDADRDGRVSRAEALAAPFHGFDRLDSNNDGTVSAREIDAVRAMRGGQ